MSLVTVRLEAARTVPHLASHLHPKSRGKTRWQEIQPCPLNDQEAESKQGTVAHRQITSQMLSPATPDPAARGHCPRAALPAPW